MAGQSLSSTEEKEEHNCEECDADNGEGRASFESNPAPDFDPFVMKPIYCYPRFKLGFWIRTINVCRALLYTPHHKHWKERGEERCITKIAKDGIAALLLLCFPFASVFNRAARARSPARESRFQFEITRVAWHWRRQTKKWRVSTQNGERALPDPSGERAPFSPFPHPLHRFEEGISDAVVSVVRAVSLESGNGRKLRERRGGGSGCLCLRLCLSLSPGK